MGKYFVTTYSYVYLLRFMVAHYVLHGKEKIAVALSQPTQLGGKLFFVNQILSPRVTSSGKPP